MKEALKSTCKRTIVRNKYVFCLDYNLFWEMHGMNATV